MADTKDPERLTLADHKLGADLAHIHDGDADHDHDDFDDGPARRQPALDAGPRLADQRRHRHRLVRHAGDLLAAAPAAPGRGPLQPLLRRRRARRCTSRRSRSRPTRAKSASTTPRSAPSSTTPTRGAGMQPDDIDTGVGDPHRRGAAPRERRRRSPSCSPSTAASSSAPPPATTWRRCSPPTARARRASRTTRASASSTSTSAAAPPSSRWSSAAAWCTTAAIHIGGRLQVVDESGSIIRLDPAGKHHAAQAGFDWTWATAPTPQHSTRSRDWMADALVAAIKMRPAAARRSRTSISPSRSPSSAASTASCSPAAWREYVYGREDARLRRPGPPLRPRAAQAARRRRAAVAAAARRRMHPRDRARRLRIQRAALRQHHLHLQPRRAAAAPEPAGAAAALSSAKRRSMPTSSRRRSAGTSPRSTSSKARPKSRSPSAGGARRRTSASPPSREGIVRGLAEHHRARRSRSTSCSTATSRRRWARSCARSWASQSELLVIDGVALWDFDYIDLGRIRMPSIHRAGDDQVAGVQRGPAPAARPDAFASSRAHHGHGHHHHGHEHR